MSIKHIEDLSYADKIRILSSVTSSCYEKLDGSSVEFQMGLDCGFRMKLAGSWVSEYDEIPQELWANDYRYAYVVGYALYESFLREVTKEDLAVPSSVITVQAELVIGNCPNTIRYNSGNRLVILNITDSNYHHSHHNINTLFYGYWSEKTISSSLMISSTNNGTEVSRDIKTLDIDVSLNIPIPIMFGYKKLAIPDEISFISDMPARDIDFKSIARKLTQDTKNKIDNIVLLFKYDLLINLNKNRSITPEGLVINVTDLQNHRLVFKVVDKKLFTSANYYGHRVKYLLLGSKFYKKKGLLDIYRDYPIDIKIQKIVKLLNWYKSNHKNLSRSFASHTGTIDISYDLELHQRTLNTFYDTIQRIKNGR